jgi:hypothetical protein
VGAQEYSAIPVHNHAGAPTADDRLQPRIYKGSDVFRVDPSHLTNKRLHLPARIKRMSVQRDDVRGIGATPAGLSERVAG